MPPCIYTPHHPVICYTFPFNAIPRSFFAQNFFAICIYTKRGGSHLKSIDSFICFTKIRIFLLTTQNRMCWTKMNYQSDFFSTFFVHTLD